jgi:hypothetical protein
MAVSDRSYAILPMPHILASTRHHRITTPAAPPWREPTAELDATLALVLGRARRRFAACSALRMANKRLKRRWVGLVNLRDRFQRITRTLGQDNPDRLRRSIDWM